MSRKIIYNIGKLAGILPAEVRKLEGKDMGHVECIDNACLIIENGIIKEFETPGSPRAKLHRSWPAAFMRSTVRQQSALTVSA